MRYCLKEISQFIWLRIINGNVTHSEIPNILPPLVGRIRINLNRADLRHISTMEPANQFSTAWTSGRNLFDKLNDFVNRSSALVDVPINRQKRRGAGAYHSDIRKGFRGSSFFKETDDNFGC